MTFTDLLEATPGKISHDSRHSEKGGYKYASVDAFYNHVRPHLIEHGWELLQDETDCDVLTDMGGKWPWVKVTYRMALVPEGTEPKVWERMTVCAPLYDVQSTGAVRSYAAKYWLRAKLLIGTGEPDSEAHNEPPQPAEVSQPTRRRKTLPKPEQAPHKPAVPCSVHGDKGDKCDWLRQAVLILIQETKPEEATMARWREAYGPAAQLVCWQLEAVRDEIREKT